MRILCVVATAFACILIPFINTLADERAVVMPEVGWWIRYGSIQTQEVAGVVQELKSPLTCSLVGTVDEGGKTCQWIEYFVEDYGTDAMSILPHNN